MRAGVERDHIYVDFASGAKASRPPWDLVIRVLRAGDTLKLTRLDQLGRSLVHLVVLGDQLRQRSVGLHVVEQGIDTATSEGRAMFGMLSVLAELQRDLIVANTRDGLTAARARGRRGGRRPRRRSLWLSGCTTLASTPCSRLPTSSACRARRCTGTWTTRASACVQPLQWRCRPRTGQREYRRARRGWRGTAGPV